ncbi:MAG: hypothetical protein DHS20C18_46050 [Saprospiraceae bacterium]|nr:MAG: hypothetical protein DHS20C18_46050 [Saprospiraceae bacterium]
MKTFKITFAIAIALLISSTTFATAPINPHKTVRKTVATWLQAPDLLEHGINETTVYLTFSVNKRNELEVREIDTEQEFLIPFILERLQGKKMKTTLINPEVVYNITISFVAEK